MALAQQQRARRLLYFTFSVVTQKGKRAVPGKNVHDGDIMPFELS